MRLRDHVVVVVVLLLTALLAILAGRRRGLVGLGRALITAIEAIGATTLFFVANLAIGVLLVLAVRLVTPFYLSLYEVTDVALLVLSLLQALTFEAWRRTARRAGPARR